MNLTVLSDEVAQALAKKRPVVALESSVWCQGLPHPFNFETAMEMEAQVRLAGAVPALLWLQNGQIHCGASEAQLQELCQAQDSIKVGAGDIPGALATGKLAATTVSASLALADFLQISTFATGGIGGVHRGWNEQMDVSADLHQLARSRCLTVCAGAKSIIDIPTTLEKLETLGVPLLMYQTDTFPEFYGKGKTAPFGSRCETAGEIARAHTLSLEVLGRAPLVVQSVPDEYALDTATLERWVEEGTEKAREKGVEGKALTPFLLDYMSSRSDGRSLDANRVLLLHNAHLAGLIAVEIAGGVHAHA